MNYEGVIIEESLRDEGALKDFKILSTKVEKVTPRHNTPWLERWTLHTVEVPANKADEAAEAISRALQSGYWYVDYKNDHTHYIVFPDKIFKIDRSQPEQYKAATEHGLTLDIPDYQLDFSPHIKEWQRQSDN